MAEIKADPKFKAAGVPSLRIVAKRDSFRRAGYSFGGEPTDIPLKTLTKEQVASLKAEPMLLVSEVEVAAEA